MRATLLLLLLCGCAPGGAVRDAPGRAGAAGAVSPDALTARVFEEVGRSLHPLGDNRRSLGAEIPTLLFTSDGQASAELGLCEANLVVVQLRPRATASELRVKWLSAHPVYYAPSPERLIRQKRRGLSQQEAEAEAATCRAADPRRYNLLTAPSAFFAARSIREVARLVEAVRAGHPPENLLCGAFPWDAGSDSRTACLEAIGALGVVDLIRIGECPNTPPLACLVASNQLVSIRFDAPDLDSPPRRITVEPVTEGIVAT